MPKQKQVPTVLVRLNVDVELPMDGLDEEHETDAAQWLAIDGSADIEEEWAEVIRNSMPYLSERPDLVSVVITRGTVPARRRR